MIGKKPAAQAIRSSEAREQLRLREARKKGRRPGIADIEKDVIAQLASTQSNRVRQPPKRVS